MNIPVSIEHIRGDTHRHHHFDFHAQSMKHGETDYHSYLDGVVYDDITKLKRNTSLNRLVVKMHDVITQFSRYQLFNGPYSPNDQTWNYVLRNTKKRINYSVSIKADQTFSCNCPAYANNILIPCKHIIIVALMKNHEINVKEII